MMIVGGAGIFVVVVVGYNDDLQRFGRHPNVRHVQHHNQMRIGLRQLKPRSDHDADAEVQIRGAMMDRTRVVVAVL